MAGAVVVSSSPTKGFTLFVMIAFSLVTVGECTCSFDCENDQVCCRYECVDGSSCLGYSCSHDSDCSRYQVETCCGESAEKTCVSGNSCLGQDCLYESDCSFNQTCCSKCVGGNTCLGQFCSSDSHCSSGQACCSQNCKAGSGCIGESCSSDIDCHILEECCKEKCVESGNCLMGDNLGLIMGLSIGGAFLFTCIMIVPCICIIIRRRRRLRGLLLGANVTQNITTTITTREDGTEVVTEAITTSISSAPVTQCNPIYQPEGPPSDQPRDQPPPYTETPTQGSGGTYAPQNDSVTPKTLRAAVSEPREEDISQKVGEVMAGAVVVSSYSTKGIALFVMIAFSLFTVGECTYSFYCENDQVCCQFECVDGSSFVGYSCSHDSDCSRCEVETQRFFWDHFLQELRNQS